METHDAASAAKAKLIGAKSETIDKSNFFKLLLCLHRSVGHSRFHNVEQFKRNSYAVEKSNNFYQQHVQ